MKLFENFTRPADLTLSLKIYNV